MVKNKNLLDDKLSEIVKEINQTSATNATSVKRSLQNHLEMHRKENKCNQCNYASSRAGDLRKHLKTHSGEKLNKCNQCDYASSQAGNLIRHIKTHSGEKSNKCNQCDYASSRGLVQVIRGHI